MSAFDFNCNSQAEMPMSSDHFGRAVFRPAPKRFSIEFLPPTRRSNTYTHGMRISAIHRGDRSSVSSRGSTQEYDIWRRWEDCLWLQDTLEKEYDRAAREKRTRLAQGKGVKAFNGMYKQDMASSWESLPPGPEPSSVARDVHAHLPMLTKKGTIFRPKPALVERRQQEFQDLIETLMNDEMPALIKEIRSSRIITDFFGFWRRDLEVEEKSRKAYAPRSSITSSVFSSYFASSSPTLYSSRSHKTSISSSATVADRPLSLASTESKSDAPRSSSRLRSSLESTDATTNVPRPHPHRSRSISSGSSSSQSDETPSDSSYTASSSAPKIAEESPVKFNHNPHQRQRTPELSSPLESLPEQNEVSLKAPVMDGQKAIHLRRRPRSSNGDRRSNRNWSVYSSPVVGEFEQEQPPSDDNLTTRESWQTVASADTYLEGLAFSLPKSPPEERASLISVSTFMTTDSANAVMPQTPTTTSPAHEIHMPRSSVPISLSDFEIMAESSEERLSLLDLFPRPLSYLPEVDSRPETPVGHPELHQLSRKSPKDLPSLAIPFPSPAHTEISIPPSPTSSTYSSTLTVSTASTEFSNLSAFSTTTLDSMSTSSTSVMSPTKGSISIKAAHNGSFIMVKVSRDISYTDMRQRLYNKFVGQEGVPLSHSFSIHASKSGSAAQSTTGEDSKDEIASEEDWREVVDSFVGSKLLLRILNPPL